MYCQDIWLCMNRRNPPSWKCLMINLLKNMSPVLLVATLLVVWVVPCTVRSAPTHEASGTLSIKVAVPFVSSTFSTAIVDIGATATRVWCIHDTKVPIQKIYIYFN